MGVLAKMKNAFPTKIFYTFSQFNLTYDANQVPFINRKCRRYLKYLRQVEE